MRARLCLRCLAVTAAAAMLIHPLRAQTAALSGTVVRDSLGHQIAGAEVALPDLKRGTTTNYLGEFKFSRLPAGKYVLVIRHIGFAPWADTVEIGDGAKVDREFMLSERPIQLADVKVTAPERKYISPALNDFEERRKAGFGHFIPEEVMRKNNERRLIDVIVGQIPGISTYTMKSAGSVMTEYLTSGRKCGAGPSILSCAKGAAACPVTLFVDGVVVYDATHQGREVPDLSRYNTREYAAVEYYAGGASMPVKYNMTSSGCGVLLLWTRER